LIPKIAICVTQACDLILRVTLLCTVGVKLSQPLEKG